MSGGTTPSLLARTCWMSMSARQERERHRERKERGLLSARRRSTGYGWCGGHGGETPACAHGGALRVRWWWEKHAALLEKRRFLNKKNTKEGRSAARNCRNRQMHKSDTRTIDTVDLAFRRCWIDDQQDTSRIYL